MNSMNIKPVKTVNKQNPKVPKQIFLFIQLGRTLATAIVICSRGCGILENLPDT